MAFQIFTDSSTDCKTSLVTYGEYLEKTEAELKEGRDVLYIACTTALSGSLNTFRLVKEELQEKYPDRKIIGLDGKRANMALGLIVLHAAELQEQGKDIDEVVKWIEDNQQYYRPESLQALQACPGLQDLHEQQPFRQRWNQLHCSKWKLHPSA